MNLRFEWDEAKALLNRTKHTVSFDEAKTVFNDPLLLSFRDDTHSDDEDRMVSIGVSVNSRLLLVVHTEQVEEPNFLLIRIISCRKATVSERRSYAS